MDKILFLLYLGLCSLQDVRKKEISALLLFGGLGAAILFKMLFSPFEDGCFVGIIPGACLLAFSLFSGEAIGYGDGVLVLTMGILFGAGTAFGVFWLGLLCAAGFSIFQLIQKKCKKTSTYPFAPFLFLAWIVVWQGGFV